MIGGEHCQFHPFPNSFSLFSLPGRHFSQRLDNDLVGTYSLIDFQGLGAAPGTSTDLRIPRVEAHAKRKTIN